MMRPNYEYQALTVIKTNTGARAYNPGDDVPASAVENMSLRVGVDVLPANVNVVPRPTANARRVEWEAYWLGQGLAPDEVDGMTRDEMASRDPIIEVSEEPPPFVVADPAPDPVAGQATEQTSGGLEPPGPGAKKADWVEHAVARGMDRQTAEDSTIAQLAEFDYDTAFGQ